MTNEREKEFISGFTVKFQSEWIASNVPTSILLNWVNSNFIDKQELEKKIRAKIKRGKWLKDGHAYSGWDMSIYNQALDDILKLLKE